MSTTLKGSKTEKYLIREITELGLEYIGGLWMKNGDYVFFAEVPDDAKIVFENKIFEVVNIHFTHFRCIVKLKITADYVNFVVSKEKNEIPEGWDCKECGKNCDADPKDYYMIKHELWKQVHPKIEGMLCMDCVEEKLGHKLTINDILICPLTSCINPYTMRILNGYYNKEDE